MEKIALINGKVLTPDGGQLETTNLLLINGVLVGIGYIPDDDDAKVVNMSKHLFLRFSETIQNSLETLDPNQFVAQEETPFQNFASFDRPQLSLNKKPSFLVFESTTHVSSAASSVNLRDLDFRHAMINGVMTSRP
ncbi:MAG: hypothetical protein ACI9BD_001491 [Candidatus Marinamargulisbacteria bacterium]|jgi:hypothetical protein